MSKGGLIPSPTGDEYVDLAGPSGTVTLQSIADLGSGGGLLSATVHITGSQIATLNSSPIEIVAAPGSGKALLPLLAAHSFVAGSSTYTGGNDMGVICYDVADPTQNAAMISYGFIGGLPESCVWGGALVLGNTSSGGAGIGASIIENAGLVVSADSNPSPSGSADGDIFSTVFYLVVDV